MRRNRSISRSNPDNKWRNNRTTTSPFLQALVMDLGKDHRRLLISQKERQLDSMVPSGESTQYYSWSITGKKRVEPKLDQISRSNYQFMVWEKS